MNNIDKDLLKRIKGRKEFEACLANICRHDKSFRKALFNNPKKAIENTVDITIPDNIKMKVYKKTAKILFLVLPMKSNEAPSSGELPENELQSVNGGNVLSVEFIEWILNKFNEKTSFMNYS